MNVLTTAAVSDPDHHRYGQHLSAEDVNELIKPSDESLALVREWLHQRVDPDSIQYTPAKDFLTISLPVAEVEDLLKTRYSTYQHDDGSKLVRTSDWSLPLHLHEHITAVQPTTSFLRPLAQAKTAMLVPGTEGMNLVNSFQAIDEAAPSVAKVCNQSSVTPNCLRTLYHT